MENMTIKCKIEGFCKTGFISQLSGKYRRPEFTADSLVQVKSQESNIYANTENSCLNFLYNVLDTQPKNLIFFHSNRQSVGRHKNQTF